MCPAWFISAGCVAVGDEALAARLANNNLGHYQLISDRWIGYLGVLDSPHWVECASRMEVLWGAPPCVMLFLVWVFGDSRGEVEFYFLYIINTVLLKITLPLFSSKC